MASAKQDSWSNQIGRSDVASFGSLQALPSFLRQFGELQDDGTYGLSTNRKSIMNSGRFSKTKTPGSD